MADVCGQLVDSIFCCIRIDVSCLFILLCADMCTCTSVRSNCTDSVDDVPAPNKQTNPPGGGPLHDHQHTHALLKVPVETKGSGNEIVEVSVKKIIENGEMQQFDCAIHMTAHNIKVVEAAHGNVLETHFMRSISSTAVYGEKKTVYIGIVSKHAVLGLKACTIFETGMATASDICESVSDAFKELMAEPNPFVSNKPLKPNGDQKKVTSGQGG